MQADEVVEGYWQHYLLSQSGARGDRLAAGDLFWAYESVEAAINGAVEPGLPVVAPVELMCKLAERAPDDKALVYLGAGPVEIYLRLPNPDVDAVERAARRSERFRAALRSAWFDENLPGADAERLRRFGPPL